MHQLFRTLHMVHLIMPSEVHWRHVTVHGSRGPCVDSRLCVPRLNCEGHTLCFDHADRLAGVGFMNTTLGLSAMQVILHSLALHIADGLTEVVGGPRGPLLKNCARLAI